MSSSPLRTVAKQCAVIAASVVATATILGSGLASAQEAPEVGTAIAEVAPANSVNSAAIINGSVTGADIADGSISRADLKPAVAPRWAKVDAGPTTTLIRGRGASTAFRVSPGVYRVTFASNIRTCGWSATVNDNDAGTAGPALISAERSSNASDTEIIVRTFNTAGALADLAENDGFTLLLNC